MYHLDIIGWNYMKEIFEEVETSRAYNGYFCSIAEAISIVVLGNICGLRNIDRYIYFYNHERIQNKTGVAPLTLRHSA